MSFDPRGVDRSDPVVCASAAETRRLLALDPAPATPAQITTVVAATKAYVADCKAHTSRLLLENVGTRTTVLDMDRLRAALGQPKLDYLGLSYGTYIGELYAERFPSKIRAMILDGAVDPALSTQASDLQQALGFETDLNDFLAWCDKNATCHAELPGGARNDYNRLFDSFSAGHSIVANFQPIYGGRLAVDLGVAELGVVSALYSEQDWPTLGQALSTGLKGNGDLLAELAYSYAGLQTNGTFFEHRRRQHGDQLRRPPLPDHARRLRGARQAARGEGARLRGGGGLGHARLRLLAGPTRRADRGHPRPGDAADPGGRLDRRPCHPLRLGPSRGLPARPRRPAHPLRHRPHRLLLERVRAELGRRLPHLAGAPAEGDRLPEQLSRSATHPSRAPAWPACRVLPGTTRGAAPRRPARRRSRSGPRRGSSGCGGGSSA